MSVSSHIAQQNIRSGQKIVEHFEHYHQNQRGQTNFQLLTAEFFADFGTKLGANGRADQQQQGEDEINRMVLGGLHDGNIDTGEENLEETGTNHNMHRHAQQIDHYGNHDETTADTHDGGKHPDEGAEHQRHERDMRIPER